MKRPSIITIAFLCAAIAVASMPVISNDALRSFESEECTIVVYRSRSLAGALYDILVSVDGMPAAILGLGHFVEMGVSPGVHHVWIKSPAALPKMISVSVSAGETVYIQGAANPVSSKVIEDAEYASAKLVGYEKKDAFSTPPPLLHFVP